MIHASLSLYRSVWLSQSAGVIYFLDGRVEGPFNSFSMGSNSVLATAAEIARPEQARHTMRVDVPNNSECRPNKRKTPAQLNDFTE